jgi:hypothetical protein
VVLVSRHDDVHAWRSEPPSESGAGGLVSKSAAVLHEAAELIDGLSPELRPLHGVRQWRERIRQAQQSPAT